VVAITLYDGGGTVTPANQVAIAGLAKVGNDMGNRNDDLLIFDNDEQIANYWTGAVDVRATGKWDLNGHTQTIEGPIDAILLAKGRRSAARSTPARAAC